MGDEGKGITTDYLCSNSKKPIVIRFSGGQQAGHTVMVDGVKHIHSNFGAGTLRGVPTYFSEHTTFYPVTIARELKILREKGFEPRLILHPLAKMTTPYDVFANRSDADNLNHGTCGLGIGKTMKRNEGPFKLHAIDLMNQETLYAKLETIGLDYYNQTLTDELIDELEDFDEAVRTIQWEIMSYQYLKNYETLVFEGSQGILLDMDHGVFPHVTYSNTVSKNAQDILDILDIKYREMYYITRAYKTRHGSGPFISEDIELINNEEEINVYNDYQREFKVANIDYNLLNYAYVTDKSYWMDRNKNYIFSINLVVTCLDQLKDFKFDYEKMNPDFGNFYESYSPDSKHFIKIK